MPTVKNVGEPCAGEPHARIDGGREETKPVGLNQPHGPGASRLPDQPPPGRGTTVAVSLWWPAKPEEPTVASATSGST
jgi:hypothetical protein